MTYPGRALLVGTGLPRPELVTEFEVEVDGQTMPILQAPPRDVEVKEDTNNSALSEYLVESGGSIAVRAQRRCG
jgi:hypothetical protein